MSLNSKIAAWFYTPDWLLVLAALLTALIVQPGEVGSVDTARRLQVTHSLWTSAPPYAETDDPTFAIPGRNGTLYPGYGIGQSLLMLPADVIASAMVAAIPAPSKHSDLRKAIVTYTVSPIVCALTVWIAFRFLKRMGFAVNHAIAGALALLFGTTFLHYTQNLMENNLLVLLTVGGISMQYAWLQTRSAASLFLGACAFGANLLIRLTTTFDLLAGVLFVMSVLWLEGARGRALVLQLLRYTSVCLPCYAFFIGVDRIYHFYRFGTWFDNYLQLAVQHHRQVDPTLPPDFPFNLPFWQGFLGPLITPEKSIFLFDPLLILLGILILTRWRSATPALKAYWVSLIALLFFYICFYAKFVFWSGDVAWGDRYVTTPVQLLGLVSVPLLLQWRRGLPVVVCRAGIAIVAASVLIQIGSVALWNVLEFQQMRTATGHTLVVALRFKNIVAVVMGKMDQWRLNNDYTLAMGYKVKTLYLYPFLIRQSGSVLPWVANALVISWTGLLATLLSVLLSIRLRTKTWPRKRWLPQPARNQTAGRDV